MAQFCFGATFAIAAFSLGLQFIQDWLGVWDDPATVKPSHPVRVYGGSSATTTQANLLVVATSLSLAFMADRDGPCWRVARLNALTGITITALVHWFLLHPLDDFRGLLWASDTLIHIIVPVLVVLGWLVFGPRRISVRVVVLGLVWPVLWLLFTLVVGRITGWYPYFFLISHRPAPAGGSVLRSDPDLAFCRVLPLLDWRSLAAGTHTAASRRRWRADGRSSAAACASGAITERSMYVTDWCRLSRDAHTRRRR